MAGAELHNYRRVEVPKFIVHFRLFRVLRRRFVAKVMGVLAIESPVYLLTTTLLLGKLRAFPALTSRLLPFVYLHYQLLLLQLIDSILNYLLDLLYEINLHDLGITPFHLL